MRERLPALDLSGHLVLPGLINAHDHLEFNLFPQLGRGPYPNAGEWARDIYRPDRSPIRDGSVDEVTCVAVAKRAGALTICVKAAEELPWKSPVGS